MRIPSQQQPERGLNWIPEKVVGPTATSSFLPAHMTSATQPPRPTSLSPDMEMALHQQVMSLTPYQFNQLPPDQRTKCFNFSRCCVSLVDVHSVKQSSSDVVKVANEFF
ncbi:unnamed protein product [Lactuca saligna]|uniref:Transcription termination and cleavage factor C-terminal domain-containing protein n=1 Tax=Lactuca saligna TaxID=75948 RepID=A0AA35YVU6_LACSI|nr:unnamed protein product [Lactuca saligna]